VKLSVARYLDLKTKDLYAPLAITLQAAASVAAK
jgi:hypothetical protein